MWKHSHYIVASRVSSIFGLTKLQRLALIYGSIVPDLKPSCYYKPHTYKNWGRYTNNLLSRLKLQDVNILFYYRLGKLLHLYTDFFTRPHNSSNIHDFISNHVKWERELDKRITSLFELDCNIVPSSFQGLVDSYNAYYKEDMFIDGIMLDLKYIQLICYYLCFKVDLLRCLRV